MQRIKHVCTMVGFITLWLSAGAATAQDQVAIIAPEPVACSDTFPGPVPKELDETQAQRLIEKVFTRSFDTRTFYIIHFVKYAEHTFIVEQQNWYVFYQDWVTRRGVWATLLDPRVRAHFNETRIFGSASVAVAFVHFNVDAVTVTQAKAQSSAKDTTLRAALIDAVVRQDPPGTERLVVANSNTDVVRLSNDLLASSTFAPLQGLSYRVDITKKIPAPIQNLEGILKLGGQGAPTTKAEVAVTPTPVCGGGAFHVYPLPSDLQVSSLVGNGDKPQTIGKQTYDNERKYWYDFSLALPLKSYKQLSLSDSGQVIAKQVEKADLFAVFNISVPFDTKHPQAQIIPVVLYGMPITTNPIQHHLLAVAIGLNRVQAFVGVRFDRKVAVSVTSAPGVATAVEESAASPKGWDHALTFGINFPVSTISTMLGAGSGKAAK